MPADRGRPCGAGCTLLTATSFWITGSRASTSIPSLRGIAHGAPPQHLAAALAINRTPLRERRPELQRLAEAHFPRAHPCLIP